MPIQDQFSDSRHRARPVALCFLLVLCCQMTTTPEVLLAQGKQNADALHQLSSSFEALVKRVSPSVVQIVVTGFRPIEEGGRGETGLVLGRQHGVGSGVIIDPSGYVLTNAHVVNGAQKIQVVMPSSVDDASPVISLLSARGRTMEAHIAGTSNELDLALLKVDAKGLPALPIGKYDKLQQGEVVFAFGSPGGLRNSVTMGVVSTVARQFDPDSPLIYIQTDAPINPGNSGGPLVDADGELVGINTFILSQSGGNEGLGFAIPSAIVNFAYPQLRKYGHLHRGHIGIYVQTITPNLAAGLGLARDWGVIVSDVSPGGPAEATGLKVQDILLALNGRPIDSVPVFGLNLFTSKAGEQLKLEVLRGTEKLSFEIPVVEREHDVDRLLDMADPDKNLIKKLGILGVDVDSKIADMLPGLRLPSGVIVVAKAAGTGEVETSLTAGDVIHSLNGTMVVGMDSLRLALDRLKPDSAVVLQIERDGKLTYLALSPD